MFALYIYIKFCKISSTGLKLQSQQDFYTENYGVLYKNEGGVTALVFRASSDTFVLNITKLSGTVLNLKGGQGFHWKLFKGT